MPTGTAILDFGPDPSIGEGNYASVDITGQTGILSTSKIEAFFEGSTTFTADEEDHLMAADNVRLACSSPVVGVGFTIHAFVIQGATMDIYNVQWVWV